MIYDIKGGKLPTFNATAMAIYQKYIIKNYYIKDIDALPSNSPRKKERIQSIGWG